MNIRLRVLACLFLLVVGVTACQTGISQASVPLPTPTGPGIATPEVEKESIKTYFTDPSISGNALPESDHQGLDQ
jgi:hypothetical protein